MPSEVSTTEDLQDLVHTVKRLKRELAEAHRRDSATAEILRVISSSSGDVQQCLSRSLRARRRLMPR